MKLILRSSGGWIVTTFLINPSVTWKSTLSSIILLWAIWSFLPSWYRISVFHNWFRRFIQRCSVKKMFLEISQNSQKNNSTRVSFLINLQTEAYNFIKKETLAQVFSDEFCEISKNTFCYRTLPVVASGTWSNRSTYTETCLGLCQTSTMELFAKSFNPLCAKSTKCSNTLKQFVGSCRWFFLSLFDHFVGLALKGSKGIWHFCKKSPM